MLRRDGCKSGALLQETLVRRQIQREDSVRIHTDVQWSLYSFRDSVRIRTEVQSIRSICLYAFTLRRDLIHGGHKIISHVLMFDRGCTDNLMTVSRTDSIKSLCIDSVHEWSTRTAHERFSWGCHVLMFDRGCTDNRMTVSLSMKEAKHSTLI